MTRSTSSACVYEGAVAHRRFKPKTHSFKYRVFSFLLDLDKLDQTSRRLRFFSRSKFNLFSIYDRDFGEGRPQDIAQHIRDILGKAGLPRCGKILLLCYPRILGYAFNPLSVYYCYDENDHIIATIYEVKNTFGGRHTYLFPIAEHSNHITQSVDKCFHVSPFIDMDMRYHFSIVQPKERLQIHIRTDDAEGPLLNAVFEGRQAPLTDKKLLALFFNYPLMTFKVILGIHWEAVKLLAKGLRLRPGAPTPKNPVTVIEADPPRAEKAA